VFIINPFFPAAKCDNQPPQIRQFFEYLQGLVLAAYFRYYYTIKKYTPSPVKEYDEEEDDL
jgi:hypothetical protein